MSNNAYWIYNGQAIILPTELMDSEGFIWTDLANNTVAQGKLGLEKAPDYPTYDATTQVPVWSGGSIEAGGAWTLQDLPAAPAAVPSTVMSRIDFLNLMTNQEVADMAVSTDANVVAFRYKLTIVTAVDRADPQTIGAIDYMGAMTPPILAAGRGADILAGNPPPAS